MKTKNMQLFSHVGMHTQVILVFFFKFNSKLILIVQILVILLAIFIHLIPCLLADIQVTSKGGPDLDFKSVKIWI